MLESRLGLSANTLLDKQAKSQAKNFINSHSNLELTKEEFILLFEQMSGAVISTFTSTNDKPPEDSNRREVISPPRPRSLSINTRARPVIRTPDTSGRNSNSSFDTQSRRFSSYASDIFSLDDASTGTPLTCSTNTSHRLSSLFDTPLQPSSSNSSTIDLNLINFENEFDNNKGNNKITRLPSNLTPFNPITPDNNTRRSISRMQYELQNSSLSLSLSDTENNKHIKRLSKSIKSITDENNFDNSIIDMITLKNNSYTERLNLLSKQILDITKEFKIVKNISKIDKFNNNYNKTKINNFSKKSYKCLNLLRKLGKKNSMNNLNLQSFQSKSRFDDFDSNINPNLNHKSSTFSLISNSNDSLLSLIVCDDNFISSDEKDMNMDNVSSDQDELNQLSYEEDVNSLILDSIIPVAFTNEELFENFDLIEHSLEEELLMSLNESNNENDVTQTQNRTLNDSITLTTEFETSGEDENDDENDDENENENEKSIYKLNDQNNSSLAIKQDDLSESESKPGMRLGFMDSSITGYIECYTIIALAISIVLLLLY